jgi:hypothetical protein
LKTANTINKKNEADPNKINHFGVWFDNNLATLRINKANYALFGEKELRFMSIEQCRAHQSNCLINFDKNMSFFYRLDSSDFNQMLKECIVSNKCFTKISNLSECDEMCGIYVMVLGRYKQVYIGQAINIKKRIVQHWRAKKEFDRLLWGTVNNSVLSIDSFGPLDTTEIYVLQAVSKDELNYLETEFVDLIPDDYKLNRIGGGGIYTAFDVLSTMHFRDLETPEEKEEKRRQKMKDLEKYQEKVAYLRFSKSKEVFVSDIQVGDIICIKAANGCRNSFCEYYCKVVSITKNYLSIVQYGKPGECEWLASVIKKLKINIILPQNK